MEGAGGKVETVSSMTNRQFILHVTEGGYSGGGGGGGGGGGHPPMMGNNQQFNSPAAPAHSQPPFKFDHHTSPAPLVPGPSPVQPGM